LLFFLSFKSLSSLNPSTASLISSLSISQIVGIARRLGFASSSSEEIRWAWLDTCPSSPLANPRVLVSDLLKISTIGQADGALLLLTGLEIPRRRLEILLVNFDGSVLWFIIQRHKSSQSSLFYLSLDRSTTTSSIETLRSNSNLHRSISDESLSLSISQVFVEILTWCFWFFYQVKGFLSSCRWSLRLILSLRQSQP
jgi:hypothetical protein